MRGLRERADEALILRLSLRRLNFPRGRAERRERVEGGGRPPGQLYCGTGWEPDIGKGPRERRSTDGSGQRLDGPNGAPTP
jgi:hypothetical protein